MPSQPLPELLPRFTQLADWLAWQETLHPKVIDFGPGAGANSGGEAGCRVGRRPAHTQGADDLNCGYQRQRLLCGKPCGTPEASRQAGRLLHLTRQRYNERICINGLQASDADLCRAFAAIDRARGEISLSYFEFGTLAAYWLMAQAALDVWVIEVGLGGRLDATNILDADIAIITSIALDHEATSWATAGS